jgi:hypothetical protein
MTAAVPVAWLQLTKEPGRLIAALAGIAFAVILMLVQLGFEEALLARAATNLSSPNCDIVLISPEYQYIMGTGHFSEHRLAQALAFEEVESVNKIYLAPTMLKNPRHRTDRASLTMEFRRARCQRSRVRSHSGRFPQGSPRRGRARPPQTQNRRAVQSRHVFRNRRQHHRQRSAVLPHLPVSPPLGSGPRTGPSEARRRSGTRARIN